MRMFFYTLIERFLGMAYVCSHLFYMGDSVSVYKTNNLIEILFAKITVLYPHNTIKKLRWSTRPVKGTRMRAQQAALQSAREV